MPAGRSVPVRAMSQSAVGLQGLARWHRVAADPRSAACALGFGAVVLLAFSDGGYYASTWGWAGLALGAVAGIQLLLRRASVPTTLGLVSLAALATLGGWMLLSASWGVDGTEATREAERCALYVVALAALLATVSSSTTRALLVGLLSGVVALAAFALGERVLAAPSLDPYQGSLLREPVGYANALGMLMALGVVLAIGLFSETREPVLRGALAGAACVSATALALTSSRGAWLAALRRRRRPRLLSLPIGANRRGDRRRQRRRRDRRAAAGVLRGPPAYWSVAISDAKDHVLSAPAPAASTTSGANDGRSRRTSEMHTASILRPPPSSDSSVSPSFSVRSRRRSWQLWVRVSARASSPRRRPRTRSFSPTLGSTGTGRCPRRRSPDSRAARRCSQDRMA